jgi:acetyl esterase
MQIIPRKLAVISLIIVLTNLLFATSIDAADTTYSTLTVEQPEHGSLTFTPAVPENGEVAIGTRVSVRADAEAGYALDTIWEAVPGQFGRMYTESRSADYAFVVDRDKVVSALFLPEAELTGLHEIQDIVFAQPGVKALKYDVFAPANAQGLPVVIIIHGGGWRTNSEDIMRGMAREIAKSGRYVAVSMDYRWAGTADGDAAGNTMADLIGDVFGGLAHIQEHAVEYGGDPQRIAVTGDSAGGHLAAVAATMNDRIGSRGFGITPGIFEFLPSYLPAGATPEQVRARLASAIKAAAPSYGVFADAAEGEVGLEHYADPAVADASWAAAIAPIHHIPAAAVRAVPHYLIRGTVDPLISLKMVQDYEEALKAQGQTVKHVEVEGASHAFFDWKPDAETRATFEQYGVPYIHDMLIFFDEVVH